MNRLPRRGRGGLHTASPREVATLPGIGEVRAGRIIDSRQQRRLLQLIADNPEARHLLTAIARVQRRRRKQAERDANRLLIALASRLRERATSLPPSPASSAAAASKLSVTPTAC